MSTQLYTLCLFFYNLKHTVYIIITVYFCQYLYFSDLKNLTCATNNSVNEQEAAFIHLLASQGHIYMGENVCLHFDQTRELRKVSQRDSSSHPRNPLTDPHHDTVPRPPATSTERRSEREETYFLKVELLIQARSHARLVGIALQQ